MSKRKNRYESRIKSITYQVLKNYPGVLTDAQKVAAAQSIYDAVIDADTSIDVNSLPIIAFGDVDIAWSNNGKTAEFHVGSIDIVDDLSDDVKVVVPGLDSGGISIIYPDNTYLTQQRGATDVEAFTFFDVGTDRVPLNNDIDRTKLTVKILNTSVAPDADQGREQWDDVTIPTGFFIYVEGQQYRYTMKLSLVLANSIDIFKVEGPGYKTLYVCCCKQKPVWN